MNQSLLLAALRVHLSHCALCPPLGRKVGLLFTQDGSARIVSAPVKPGV